MNVAVNGDRARADFDPAELSYVHSVSHPVHGCHPFREKKKWHFLVLNVGMSNEKENRTRPSS